ncbi:DUF1659 domain-containing protein [Tepidibacillus fermentans]|uniref:Uncharacterized protein DUF1659 n=1 Tax=Tepidibacillus fermentans TaxID=1281767 RepID=A0A4R3KF34_9BACI|nr:DUF1659 domain-containing protein [Tepidibacillus fermentans]TCS81251.1 uncharacterized protein DUF1659 [Tepidibacillus fermentans]
MAVSRIADLSKLVITSQIGTDSQGQPILKSKTYNGVKAAALDQDVYDVAQSLGSLQKNPVYRVERIDREEIIQA